MNEPKTFKFKTQENLELEIDFHTAKKNRKNITIVYFHGGGLLYGERNDLPEIYVNIFLASGYDFLTCDYPLAPETKLDIILKSAFEALSFCIENPCKPLGVKNDKYILFGRSAGAYICFMLCNMLIKSKGLMPIAIICLYGYARLDEVQFNKPSSHYGKLPGVSDESAKKITSDKPVTHGPMSQRFSLYIKARQEGSWIKQLLSVSEDPIKYSLEDEILKALPPAIFAAATMDPDVPYKTSKTLCKLIPDSRLITIYGEVHDFDRDTNSESGKSTYEEIIKWLDGKTGI